MIIKHFFDKDTSTLTYLVYDEQTKDCVIIDPVLNYNAATGEISTVSIDEIICVVSSEHLNVQMILETHVHADHLSSSHFLKEHFPKAILAIGENIQLVQETFKKVFNLGEDFPADGSQFDKLLKDNEEVTIGSLSFKVLFTPGHTPACASYLFGEALFTGDSLFMPDFGTGRCDFPLGSAEDLCNSVKNKIYRLPDATRVFVGHDYQPGGRELAFETTISEQKKKNIQLNQECKEDDFCKFRKERDATLSAPKLLLPSLQVNIRAGQLPDRENNGKAYIKIPITFK